MYTIKEMVRIAKMYYEIEMTQKPRNFFSKNFSFGSRSKNKSITVDKNPSYPAAIEILKKNKEITQDILMRQVNYFE